MIERQWIKPGAWAKLGALPAVGALALAGCGGDSAPAPSPEGLANFACALVEDIDTPIEEWDLSIGGSEIDGELVSASAAASLLGARSGFPLEGYPDLYPAEVPMGVAQLNPEILAPELEELREGCESEGLPAKELDLSTEGRIGFACTLIADVNQSGGSIEDWVETAGEEDPGANGFTLTEVFGATGLVGVDLAVTLAGHEEISEAATQMVRGATTLNIEAIDEGLDAFNGACS